VRLHSGPVRVAVVSAGAMGSAIGAALRRGGAGVATTLDGRSARTARLAHQAGLECLPDLDTLVGAASIVLSVAPPDQAEGIAADLAAAAGRTGARPLVADLNAIAPATVLRLERTLGAAGLDLVDGSVSGPPPHPGGSTRIYLSGARAGEMLALSFDGVELVPVDGAVGAASAVKMCTASVYKGSVALLAHALLTAQANGVLGHVLDDLGDLASGGGHSIARAATKSGRYVGEMQEIAATQAAAGLPPALFEAMAEVYATFAERPLAREDPESLGDTELEDVLRDLAPDGG
jgi:3-hydroxyisobutyrate dehydrogenase-like beta-hydroxyacid dehydrogenase